MQPESKAWNGYLEDTIVIDWQTPAIVARARALAAAGPADEAKARACYEFVRDEIAHTGDAGGDALPCRASEVLAAGTGIGFAKSHLLAALLRSLGIPAGFCYQVIRREPDSPERVLYGFNGVYLASHGRWIQLDARGNRLGLDAQFSIEPPRLARAADPALGEFVYPWIFTRPAQVVVDLLSRNKSLARVADHFPDELPGVAHPTSGGSTALS
jgi:transglutaminase-like putative cysteine protease